MKTNKNLLAALITLAALSTPALAQEPVRFASSTPLTGGVAAFGQHSRWGAELAIAEANDKGGILGGRKVEMDFQDNRCNPAEAVKSVSQMLADKKYAAIHDGLCSSVVLAIMPLAERAGVPLVVANGSATSIAEKSGVGGNKWTFKVNPSDLSMLDAMVGYLDKIGQSKSIAFLGEDTDFGRGGANGLEIGLAKRNLKLASSDFFPKGTPDFTSALTKLKAQKPSQITLFAIDADFVNLIKQWYGLGAGIPLSGRIVVDQIPKEILSTGALDGLIAVQPYDPAVDNPANNAFVAEFKKRHNEAPLLTAFESYETTKVMIDAVTRAGTTEPAAVRDALQKTKLQSILGEIEFDDHNLAHNNAVILTVKGGKTQIIGLSKT